MTSVLFVDDEPKVLRGIENALRALGCNWELCFVERGRTALDMLSRTSFDAIVSDMRMPEMNGAELLREVQTRYPETIRLVLSGFAEFEATLRAIPVAHHFLLKPCDGETLMNAVERGLLLKRHVNDPDLRREMGSITGLPPLPRTYAALTAELARDPWELVDVVRIVERDPSIVANAFRLANSSALARRRTVTNVREAVLWIGTNMLKNVILAAETFPAFAQSGVPRSLFEEIEREAALCGAVASRLVDEKFMSENAFLAGALHDTGRLVLALKNPEAYADVMRQAKTSGPSLEALERANFGMTHSAAGAFLLGSWGLPYPVAEAVAWHHCPSQVVGKRIDVIGAVHIADVLVAEHFDRGDAVLDEQYLDRVGGRKHLDRWRKLVAELATTK